MLKKQGFTNTLKAKTAQETVVSVEGWQIGENGRKALKKAKTVPSVEKVVASFYCDSHSLVFRL